MTAEKLHAPIFISMQSSWAWLAPSTAQRTKRRESWAHANKSHPTPPCVSQQPPDPGASLRVTLLWEISSGVSFLPYSDGLASRVPPEKHGNGLGISLHKFDPN